MFSICDKNLPIVVLFGPPASGKSMALIRLCQYLCAYGYIIEPIRTLRPFSDFRYRVLCDEFHGIINGRVFPRLNYVLLRVADRKGKFICQILKLPGEWCLVDKVSDSHNILDELFSCRKLVWITFVDLNWGSIIDRESYVIGLKELWLQRQHKNDEAIVLLCKIDQLSDFAQLYQEIIDSNYYGLLRHLSYYFSPYIFSHRIPILRKDRFFRKRILPFNSGTYVVSANYPFESFIPGSNIYPEHLWKTIKKIL